VRPALAAVVASLALLAACSGGEDERERTAGGPAAGATPATRTAMSAERARRRRAGETVTVVATADASCREHQAPTAKTCRQGAVSDRVMALDPDALIMAGDACYDDRAPGTEPATRTCLERAYGPTYGRMKAKTLPVVGNHECYGPEADRCGAHYDYWGELAGPRDKGYYARAVGAWLVVVLNTECAYVGGCHAGSPQERWLRQTLEADTGRCELIAMHKPLISSGHHGDNPTVAQLWKAAQDNGAELAIQGHDHHLERFGALTSTGAQNDAIGLRSFITGAGGKSHYVLRTPKPHSRFRNATDFGVLALTLSPTDYSAAFISETGATLHARSPVPCR
jgi:hypothetical protein